jgi:prepilin-type N-terminal cleavage/methylation domain-containing protein
MRRTLKSGKKAFAFKGYEMNTKMRCSKQSGFTLIELSVVMVIIGLLMVAIIGVYSTHLKREQILTTKENIVNAREAVQAFQQKYGYYPCPADPTSPSIETTRDCSGALSAGLVRVPAGGGEEVIIGVLPAIVPDVPTPDGPKDVKLVSGSEALDGYRHRLTYAVTRRQAIPTDIVDPLTGVSIGFRNNGGVIRVNNGNGVQRTDSANFIILSHGEDGNGGYRATGEPSNPCPAGGATVDAANCDGDATFVIVEEAENAVTEGGRSYALGVTYNDDFGGFETETNAMITQNCTAGQFVTGISDAGVIECSNIGAMGCDPGEAMVGILPDGAGPDCRAVSLNCAAGEVLVSFQIGGAPRCVRNLPGDCPAGHVQRGTIEDPSSPNYGDPICYQILMNCPANYVQVGISAGNTPICVPNFNNNCPGGQLQIGNNSDGSANCMPLNVNACPAGQYIYGVNNGSPLCSGDQKVADITCPEGEFVKSFTNGVPTCGKLTATLGECTLFASQSAYSATNCNPYWGCATMVYPVKSYPHDAAVNPYNRATRPDSYSSIYFYRFEDHPDISTLPVASRPSRAAFEATYPYKSVNPELNEVVCHKNYYHPYVPPEVTGGGDVTTGAPF